MATPAVQQCRLRGVEHQPTKMLAFPACLEWCLLPLWDNLLMYPIWWICHKVCATYAVLPQSAALSVVCGSMRYIWTEGTSTVCIRTGGTHIFVSIFSGLNFQWDEQGHRYQDIRVFNLLDLLARTVAHDSACGNVFPWALLHCSNIFHKYFLLLKCYFSHKSWAFQFFQSSLHFFSWAFSPLRNPVILLL